MSDMSVNRVPGEYTATDLSAKLQSKTDAGFADLLRSVGAAASAQHRESPQPQTAAAANAPAARVYRQDTSGWLGKVSVPGSPASASQTAAALLEKLDGESDEDWQRRCITFETARRWQVSSRAWKAESADMDFVEGMLYCDEKATQWVTDLMNSEPAMFREWLNQEKWHMEESGIDNAILSAGLTEEDMSRWMEKDVLEYL